MANVARFKENMKKNDRVYLINSEDNLNRLATLERCLIKFKSEVIGKRFSIDNVYDINIRHLVSDIENNYEVELLRDIKALKKKLKIK